MQVIFFGTKGQGLHGDGKQLNFIRVATPVLYSYGHSVHKIIFPWEITYLERNIPTLVCMIYNEENVIETEILTNETILKGYFSDLRIIHTVERGGIIGDKVKTMHLFQKYSIPIPQIISSKRSQTKTIARWNLGSGLPTELYPPGAHLDQTKVNTEFINTSVDYRGKAYFVCLRFMCFWEQHVSTYVRCRPVSDGDPSVHTSTTPVDAGLLNDLFSRIVTPRRDEIHEICKKAGQALGPGFYSHDVLPPNDGSELRVCETGFKYDEMLISRLFERLSGQLLMSDIFNNVESLRMAYALCMNVDRIPRWTEN